MKTLSFWKKPLYSALVFFGTLLVLSVGYSLVGNLSTADKVGSGSGLTATSWNKIVDGILDLDSKLSNLSFSGGSVGIGTASPDYKLDVAEGISRVYNTISGKKTGAAFYQSTGGFWIDSFEWGGAGAKNLLLNPSGGNIGINSTNPKAKLEVNGDFIRTIARVQGYSQTDQTDNGAIATRTLTFVKKQADTGIRVTYSDGRRIMGVGANGGRWEARFNAVSCANPGPLGWDIYEGMTGNDYHRTDTTVGTCFGLAAGIYTVQIYVGPAPGYAVSDLYTGWQGAWSLEAEEVR